MTLAWRIYYGDGSTFDSSQGDPGDAPAWNVQAVVQTCPWEGKHVVTNHDFYWRDGGAWRGGDLVGLVDALSRNCGPVRIGRWLSAQDYEALVRRACDDPDFVGNGTWRRD